MNKLDADEMLHRVGIQNVISFDEILHWQQFEDLVADYFRETKEPKNITEIKVEPSGVGSDGGRDILVTFRIDDSVIVFERKWIVQCKFYDRPLSARELADINIPTLIHQYKGNGYLLICKGQVTNNVSKMFEDLRDNCKLGYDYMIWTGDAFISQLYMLPPRPVIQKHFPAYFAYVESQEGRVTTL